MNTRADKSAGGNARATLSEVAEKLNSAARSRWQISQARPLPPLLLLSDETRLPDPAPALAALPAGSGFIFRHYDAPYREEQAKTLCALAQARGILFLVAGDIDLARAVGADGCHMPEYRAADLEACRGDPHLRFNTGAAHSKVALETAAKYGAHAALLSPVFTTRSHPDGTALGGSSAAKLAGSAPLPTYALGGINCETALSLAGSAFAGLAAIDGLGVAEGQAEG